MASSRTGQLYAKQQAERERQQAEALRRAQAKARADAADAGESEESVVRRLQCDWGKLDDTLAGTTYEGDVDEENRPHGTGRMRWGDTGDVYEGEWRSGLMQGRGTYTWGGKIGKFYAGEWHDNMMHGKGTLTNPRTQCVYTGEFRQGMRCGDGISTWENGTRYEGQYSEGLRNGQGTYQWGKLPYGRAQNYKQGPVYDGEWVNGEMNGQGHYATPWQTQYTGAFDDGQFGEAGGIYTYEDGDVCEGGYKQGARHGLTSYTYHDGRSGSLEFHEGDPIEDTGTGVFNEATDKRSLDKLKGLKPRPRQA